MATTNLDSAIQQFVNQNEEDRIAHAKNATKEIGIYLSSCGFTKKEALNFYLNIVRLFVSADNKCGETEYILFKKVLNVEMSYDSFFELTNGGATDEFIEAMDRIIDNMKYEIKIHVCTLGLTIICSDGVVSESERELIKKIVES